MKSIALRSLSAFALVVANLAALAPAQQAKRDVAKEIQASVQTLRASQKASDGSYGNVAETAWALRAFAECSAKYRIADGDFVKRAVDFLVKKQAADGAIADDDAKGEAREDETRLAAAALTALATAEYQKPLGRALEHLGANGLKGPGWQADPEPDSTEDALELVIKLATSRTPDGWSTGPRGKVIETADAIIMLSLAERVLAKNLTEKGEPRPPTTLPPFSPADRDGALASVVSGAKFLASLADHGTYGEPHKPNAGITAMCLSALQVSPEPRDAKVQATIDEGLKWLVTLQKPDGSIHQGMLANYVTSASIQALARSKKPEFQDALGKARAYLQKLQLDEGEGAKPGDSDYGGIGYEDGERPDLSNLQMALEALHDTGLAKDDPTYKKALIFLQRCQNRSESNDLKLVDGKSTIVSGDDGGSAYRPGDSKAGFIELPDGRKIPRSYGSMTYALLKCLVFAGVPKEDPRLKACYDWCRKNYTLDVNPGFVGADASASYQGLFYYFSTVARALGAYGQDEIVDGAGKSHNWRAEIAGRIVSMQSKIDKSWINNNSPRWFEGNPLLATSYALLTLDATLAK